MNSLDIKKYERILKLLYCRSICTEFRRPVDSCYPGIMQSYMKIIQKPMDLGSILYKIMANNNLLSTISIEDIKHEIQLVFENALKFNAGTPLMEAISIHADSLAGGLYEEAFDVPYRLDVNLPKEGSQEESFTCVKLSRRRWRLYLVKDLMLNNSELKHLEEILVELNDKFPNYSSHWSHIFNRLQNNDKEINESISSIVSSIIISCSKKLIDDTSLDSMQPSILGLLLEEKKVLMNDSFDASELICLSYCISLEHQAFVCALDDLLGELLVCIHERYTRGCTYSCIWACPTKVVWAQPAKTNAKEKSKSSWFLGMVIAGGNNTDIRHALTDINISRVPIPISAQLARLKPKYHKAVITSGLDNQGMSMDLEDEVNIDTINASNTSEDIIKSPETITSAPISTNSSQRGRPKAKDSSHIQYGKVIPTPLKPLATLGNKGLVMSNQISNNSNVLTMYDLRAEGKYIIEFFGSHDLGWIKAESIVAFDPVDPIPQAVAKSFVQDSLEEAMLAYTWIQKHFKNSKDISSSEADAYEDDTVLPSLKDLFDSIQHPPRPTIQFNEQTQSTSSHSATSHTGSSKKGKVIVRVPVTEVILKNTFDPKRFPLTDNDTKSYRSRALARTRIVTQWMDTVKPILIPSSTSVLLSSNTVPMIEIYGTESSQTTKKTKATKKNKDSLQTVGQSNSQSSKRSFDEMKDNEEQSNQVEETTTTTNTTSKSNGSTGTVSKGSKTSQSTYVPIISTPSMIVQSGDGIVHSKSVNFKSDLFFFESKSIEKRKEILKKEIQNIEENILRLQDITHKREVQLNIVV